jgi:hypothetical protein
MISKGVLELYGDAIAQSCTTRLSKVFDNIVVRTRMDHNWHVSVNVSATFKGTRISNEMSYPIEMLTPYDYANFFRDELPRRVAHSFLEYLIG